MKRKAILLQLIFISLMISCSGQINENLTYDEIQTLAISSFRNNNTDSSIMLMEYALKKFPEELGRSTNVLAAIYIRVGLLPKAIEIWEMGNEIGYYYGLDNVYYQQYYKDNADFEQLVEMEKRRTDSLHLKYEVLLPTDYNTENTYPILFVFHGNSRNIAKSKLSWNAPIMAQEFITVFMQSYIPGSFEDFKWVDGDEKIKTEFKEIYDQILMNYPVNHSKIIFAGMSAGGRKALEFTMNDYFPVSGLVLNCPVIPENITDEMITKFVDENKKIGIITGGEDFALENQKNLVSSIDKLAGHSRITVNEGLGHSFADNFTQLLDDYLKWVIE
jgi:predicted esterase